MRIYIYIFIRSCKTTWTKHKYKHEKNIKRFLRIYISLVQRINKMRDSVFTKSLLSQIMNLEELHKEISECGETVNLKVLPAARDINPTNQVTTNGHQSSSLSAEVTRNIVSYSQPWICEMNTSRLASIWWCFSTSMVSS